MHGHDMIMQCPSNAHRAVYNSSGSRFWVCSVQKLIPADVKYNNDQNSKSLIDVNMTRFFVILHQTINLIFFVTM